MRREKSTGWGDVSESVTAYLRLRLSMFISGRFVRRAAAVALVALLASACGRKQASSPAPVPVEVVPVVQKDVPIVGEWIGTLDGSVNADIRPKVEGYVLRQHYKEGQFVHRNDLLFEIDPRQFRAALEQAHGTLARAESQLSKASKDVERFTPLAADRAISQQELDNAVAAERDGRGAVAAAKAAQDQAALNLEWTKVRSPIEGVVGIARAQVGDLVNTQFVMTTVSTVDPIRVTFGISEREYMERAASINRASYPTTERGPSLDLILEDGHRLSREGQSGPGRPRGERKDGNAHDQGLLPQPAQHPPSGPVRAHPCRDGDAAECPRRSTTRRDRAAGWHAGGRGGHGRQGGDPRRRAGPPHGRPVGGREGTQGRRERHRERPAVRAVGHADSREDRRAPPPLARPRRRAMSRFFVDRPIVAIVIAVLTVILGVVSLAGLPVAQYPSIIPPVIQISTTYTGAGRDHHRAVGGHADRAADERGGQDAVPSSPPTPATAP
jgi:biotin carboxyl carrier protein